MTRRLFLADDPLFEEHRPAGYHPERPERLLAARRAVEGARGRGVALEEVGARDATRDDILAAHDEALLAELERVAGRAASLDADTWTSPRSIEAATRAAGLAIAVTQAALEAGERAGALALLRPPGHHATRRKAMGFCLLNNVAIAARWARAHGASRVAIVDFDVHHGNGTQDIFYDDPSVLFVSLHQAPFYPGTGTVEETGEGEGRGATLNVPLSAHATDATYDLAFRSIVEPAVEAFAPDLVLVSAGFDAHARDPLAQMLLTERAYGSMVTGLSRIAGDRPLVLLLEGGYDLTAIEGSLGASLDALAEREASPSEDSEDEASAPSLTLGHQSEIARARRNVSLVR